MAELDFNLADAKEESELKTIRVHDNPMSDVVRAVSENGKILSVQTGEPGKVQSMIRRAVRDLNENRPKDVPEWYPHTRTAPGDNGKTKVTFAVNHTPPRKGQSKTQNKAPSKSGTAVAKTGK